MKEMESWHQDRHAQTNLTKMTLIFQQFPPYTYYLPIVCHPWKPETLFILSCLISTIYLCVCVCVCVCVYENWKKCRHVLINAKQSLENRPKICWLYCITLLLYFLLPLNFFLSGTPRYENHLARNTVKNTSVKNLCKLGQRIKG